MSRTTCTVVRRGSFRRVAELVAVAATVALIAAVLALPPTQAAFSAITDSAANTFNADTLEPPAGLTAGDGGTIALGWTPTGDTYAEGHRIFRSTTPGGPYTQVAEITPRATATHVDSPPYNTYYYVARAFFGTWESSNSNEAMSSLPFDCPADPDLRACIRFDADVAGTYLDESGNSNTVIQTNGALVQGVTGSAAAGLATARYEMADSPSLDLTDAMTVETWARFDSLPTSGRAGLLDNDGQYSLILYADTGLRCSNGIDDLPHVPVPAGVWFHAACTWDGTTLTLYIDGQPLVSMLSSGTIDTTSTDPVSVANTSPVWDEPMDGAMDNLRIWHAGRTQAQICVDAGLVGC